MDFGDLGGPGRPGNALKRWGGFAPHLFEGFPGRPGEGRGQFERENVGFLGSGRPRAAGKPSEKMGGFAPHLFGRFPGPAGLF